MGADDNEAGVPLSAIARRYEHFLIDLDGCLWVGDEPTDRATDALAALREASKGIVFMTNDARHAPRSSCANCGPWASGRRSPRS